MSKNKVTRSKARLPRAAQEVLRHKGGAHGTQKGQRGYDRNAEKRKLMNLISANKPARKELAFLLIIDLKNRKLIFLNQDALRQIRLF
jgi:hypothetical protein